MIDAPVGIQCPICAGRMREGAMGQAAYRARTAIGGTRTGRRIAAISATRVVIGINLAVFAAMLLTGEPTSARTLVRFGALVGGVLPLDEWWRIATSMFIHIGFLHLAFNMYALFLFGTPVERRYGTTRFLALYLLSGLGGGAASLVFTDALISAGASGGVFGVLGAWIAIYLAHRSMPGAAAQLRSLFLLVAINLAIGFTAGGIDNAAHLGGLAAGFVIGTGLEYAGRSPQRAPVALAGYLVVIVVAVLAIRANAVPTLGL